MALLSKNGMKEMAELLRSGAKMLNYNCPECGSPLFQLKSGEIWCGKCQRRVVIVSEDEDESAATKDALWRSLERNIIDRISLVNRLLSAETEPSRIKELVDVVSVLLTSLEKLRRLRKG